MFTFLAKGVVTIIAFAVLLQLLYVSAILLMVANDLAVLAGTVVLFLGICAIVIALWGLWKHEREWCTKFMRGNIS